MIIIAKFNLTQNFNLQRFPEMDIAEKPGEHIRTSAQIYPDSKPVEVPPRPTRTGADPRVAGESSLIDPAEIGTEQ